LASYDISIRGAGIFGLSIAWTCVAQGATVQVVDPKGVAAGASGGVVGALAPHVPENWNPKKQFQFESLILAEAFWADVAQVSGQSPGYIRAGRVQPLAKTANALELAHARAEGAAKLWQGKAMWRVTDDSGGWDVTSTGDGFIHDTLSAHMHPRQALSLIHISEPTRPD